MLETMFFSALQWELERLLLPTLALEVNIARLQGTLAGDTPVDRFANYLEQLHTPTHLDAFAAEYSELFRHAARRVERWVAVSYEATERLCLDWEALCTTFGMGRPLGALQHITYPQRTTKRNGRAVMIFTFATGVKLVYKPRSLAIEEHFQALLSWLHRAGFEPTFRHLPLLDRGSYGWMMWVEAQPCQSRAELWLFYQRQGGLLALLYALEATDLHLSNIIAQGEHPMLIDLEALFHPRDGEPPWPPLELALDQILYHSVLRPGLLPEPELGDDERADPIDLSGLGGTPGQLTPYAVPTWQAHHTDRMHLTYQPKTIRGGNNLPTLHGQPVHITDFRHALDEGFSTLYGFLMVHRSALLANDGPLTAFAGDEVRVIARPGQEYSKWLAESIHPNLLRNGLDRPHFLARRLRADVARHPHLAALLPYEQAALTVGDAPLFTTRADGRALDYANHELVADFFPQSGLAAARARIECLCEDDLTRQRWFIQAALATVPLAHSKSLSHYPTPPKVVSSDLSTLLLDRARTLGEWLAKNAVCAGDEASWLGVVRIADRHWFVESLENDLYNGLPGVALFLAQLGHLTGEARWTTLAQQALATIQRYLDEESAEIDLETDSLLDQPVGILDGVGGLLYAFAHLATLWQSPALLAAATAQVQQLRQQLDLLCPPLGDPADSDAVEVLHDEVCLARGLAGTLVGLLALYQVDPAPTTLQAARQVGDQILARIARLPLREPPQGARVPGEPFASFFHHKVGVAWPLLTLADISGEQRFRACAEQIVAPTPPAGSTPGLWLAYLRALPLLTEGRRRVTLEQHFQVAFPALLVVGLGHNDTLGHGDLGYLELLQQAGQTFQDPTLHEQLASYAAGLLLRDREIGWRTAVPLGVETPGLMAGLAGIGHGLLRLAMPACVPSLLALELPMTGSATDATIKKVAQ